MNKKEGRPESPILSRQRIQPLSHEPIMNSFSTCARETPPLNATVVTERDDEEQYSLGRIGQRMDDRQRPPSSSSLSRPGAFSDRYAHEGGETGYSVVRPSSAFASHVNQQQQQFSERPTSALSAPVNGSTGTRYSPAPYSYSFQPGGRVRPGTGSSSQRSMLTSTTDPHVLEPPGSNNSNIGGGGTLKKSKKQPNSDVPQPIPIPKRNTPQVKNNADQFFLTEWLLPQNLTTIGTAAVGQQQVPTAETEGIISGTCVETHSLISSVNRNGRGSRGKEQRARSPDKKVIRKNNISKEKGELGTKSNHPDEVFSFVSGSINDESGSHHQHPPQQQEQQGSHWNEKGIANHQHNVTPSATTFSFAAAGGVGRAQTPEDSLMRVISEAERVAARVGKEYQLMGEGGMSGGLYNSGAPRRDSSPEATTKNKNSEAQGNGGVTPTPSMNRERKNRRSPSVHNPDKDYSACFDRFGEPILSGEGIERDFRGNPFFRFKGNYKGNRRSGEGVLMLQDGTILNGPFVEKGELTGKGVKFWPTGACYYGHFMKGEPHGEGMLVKPGGYCYEGQFSFGVPHGLGVWHRPETGLPAPESWLTGGVYKGEFRDSKPHGKGVLKTEEGTLEGIFSKGQPHEHCIAKFHGGDWYEGPFLNGVPHGKGVFFAAKTGVTFHGDMLEGSRATVANVPIVLDTKVVSNLPTASQYMEETGLTFVGSSGGGGGSSSTGKNKETDMFNSLAFGAGLQVRVAAGVGGSLFFCGKGGYDNSSSVTTSAQCIIPASRIKGPQGNKETTNTNNNGKGAKNAGGKAAGKNSGANNEGGISSNLMTPSSLSLAAPTSMGGGGTGSTGTVGSNVFAPVTGEAGRKVSCAVYAVPSTLTVPLHQLRIEDITREWESQPIYCDGCSESTYAGDLANFLFGSSSSPATAGSSPQVQSSSSTKNFASKQRLAMGSLTAAATLGAGGGGGGGSRRPSGQRQGSTFQTPQSTNFSPSASLDPSMLGLRQIEDHKKAITVMKELDENGECSFTIKFGLEVEPGECVIVFSFQDPKVVLRPNGEAITQPGVFPAIIPVRLLALSANERKSIASMVSLPLGAN